MIKVTDKEFWMHPTLKQNIDSLVINAENDWDFVIIVSGSGTTRTGKSMFAQQLGYYLAHQRGVNFDINNVVFAGEDLIKSANESRKSVFIYDEGREGLDAKRIMSDITLSLLDFFAECGMYNHFLILVLPDFFELPKGIAITRSKCLINVWYKTEMRKTLKAYKDIKKGQSYVHYDRGMFSFFNSKSKKDFYIKGKKNQDYSAGKPNFNGEFRNRWIIPYEDYEAKKLEFLRRQRGTKEKKEGVIEQHWKQRLYWVLRGLKVTNQQLIKIGFTKHSASFLLKGSREFDPSKLYRGTTYSKMSSVPGLESKKDSNNTNEPPEGGNGPQPAEGSINIEETI